MVFGFLTIFFLYCTSAVSAEEKYGFQLLQDTESLSDLEKTFVELAKKHQGVYQLGDLFVIALGEQPNPGYGLRLEKQVQTLEELHLHVKRTYPKKGLSYPQVISYPYLIGRLTLPPYTTLSVIDDGEHFSDSGLLTFEGTRYIADVKKEWTITFNQPISSSSLEKMDIFVADLEEKKHPVQIKINPKNKREVLVLPLEEYQKDKIYLLRVENSGKVFVVPFEVRNELEWQYDFNYGLHGWVGNFSDLPVNYSPSDYVLETGHRQIPHTKKNGLYLSGMNRSDDLFMYAKKKIDGLLPNHTYHLNMEIDFYTNVAPGLVGVGGAPGEAVYVKAGASTIEPKTVQEGNDFRMNMDIGEQASSGKDAVVIGNVALEQEADGQYKLKQLKTQQPLTVKTNANGELWVLFGADSGFEGLTSIYYSKVKVALME